MAALPVMVLRRLVAQFDLDHAGDEPDTLLVPDAAPVELEAESPMHAGCYWNGLCATVRSKVSDIARSVLFPMGPIGTSGQQIFGHFVPLG